MRFASYEELKRFDREAEMRKQEILQAKDSISVSGCRYYVSADGNDENCGTDERHAWKSLEKVSSTDLRPGDAVLFRRGDIFRGQVVCREGVTYAAWGTGAKPAIYGWKRDLADAGLWEIVDEEHSIYHLKEKILDCGTLVFNHGERHSLKLIPSYVDGKFVCRENESVPFVMAAEMKNDLDIFCDCTAVLTRQESHGETWPVPKMCAENLGDLYLRCDEGNPGSVFSSIEALPGRHTMLVRDCANVHIDNLCLKYCGAHAISAGGKSVKGLHVSNCEIGWVGGTIQHYFGTDPNYLEGTRGSVTRFGNGIEIYGGCEDYLCTGNYVYQVYDAGLTHQVTVFGKDDYEMKNVRYSGNLIENCVYSIEYFLSLTGGTNSLMNGLEIDHNIMRFAGCGWGRQRHNIWTGAHIKSWTFENPACDYCVHDNVFDRAAYRLLHICCSGTKDYPKVERNTYIQTLGLGLGQFGEDENAVPPVISFMENADEDVKNIVRDAEASVYWVK